MWCTQGIFILCVMNVVTTMVIGVDIGAHYVGIFIKKYIGRMGAFKITRIQRFQIDH
jgi:hypothetical protein